MNPSRLLLLALALCCVSCSDSPRLRAEKIVRKLGAERLRLDAAVVYKEYFSAHTLDFVVLRTTNCPPSIQSFSPQRIGLYPDGLAVGIDIQDNHESGLYIIPQSMDHTPKDTPNATFQKIADGIFWYSFSG